MCSIFTRPATRNESQFPSQLTAPHYDPRTFRRPPFPRYPTPTMIIHFQKWLSKSIGLLNEKKKEEDSERRSTVEEEKESPKKKEVS